MASVVLMPQIGISVESCIITEWFKKPGDQISVGDILFSYETDKSSLECESTEEGELLEIFFNDGDEVPVLTAVCAVGKAGEDVSHLRPDGGEEQEEAPAATTEAEPAKAEVKAEVVATPVGDGDLKISPRARNLAEKQKVDTNLAAGTGPYGRVIERDIRKMVEDGVGIMTGAASAIGSGDITGTGIGGRVSLDDLAFAPEVSSKFTVDGPDYEDVTFTGIRKAISKGMTASLRDIPQLTHNFSFDASDLLSYRKKIKSAQESMDLPNITLNDFILYAVSRMLLKYPELNAHMLDGETIRYFKDVHLGMAVDTPRGLMVPVIKYANRKTLAQISEEAKDLAQQAIKGNISPDYLTGATFTVSNLGTVGVESFTPVINAPETGILGVCNITQRLTEVDGELTAYPAMGISLTYDHRAIDGAPASRFASELCRNLENFTVMLAK